MGKNERMKNEGLAMMRGLYFLMYSDGAIPVSCLNEIDAEEQVW